MCGIVLAIILPISMLYRHHEKVQKAVAQFYNEVEMVL